MGPIAHFGETETLRRENREFTLQSRWDRSLTSVRPKRYEGKQRDYNPISVTEIPIGKTDLLRVCGRGYDFWNRWRRIGSFGVTDFGFVFRSFVEVGK